jgi:hypothetical protein
MNFPPPYQQGHRKPYEIYDCHENGPALIATCVREKDAKFIVKVCNHYDELLSLRNAVTDFLRAQVDEKNSYSQIIAPVINAWEEVRDLK